MCTDKKETFFCMHYVLIGNYNLNLSNICSRWICSKENYEQKISGGTTPTPNDSGFDSFGNFWLCDSGFDSHFKLANPESHGSGCNSQIIPNNIMSYSLILLRFRCLLCSAGKITDFRDQVGFDSSPYFLGSHSDSGFARLRQEPFGSRTL
jgi:hypothetical protein